MWIWLSHNPTRIYDQLSISPFKNYILFAYENINLYVFESNHDVELLMHGRYPAWLKKRIRSDEGHLSNNQCGFYCLL